MRRQKWNAQQMFLGIIGVVLVASMLIALFAPGLATSNTSNTSTQPTEYDTSLLTPQAVVFPTPVPGTPEVALAGTFVHPTGMMAVLRPQAWAASTSNTATVVSVSMVNSTAYSVLHAYLQQYDYALDAATLDALTDAAALADSWSEYDGWTETNRAQVDDRLVIDFELALLSNTYLARQISWAGPGDLNTWAVVLRLVVPGNNPALLERLEALVLPSVQVLPDAFAAPISWPTHLDSEWGFTLRYPPGWELADGGSGRPTTLIREGYTLSLNVQDGTTLADEDAARAWLEAERAGADVLAVEPVTRAFGEGYALAYTYPDADGALQSGLAVLVNGADRLYTASLLLGEGETNLLAEGARESDPDLWTMLDTFAPLPADIIGDIIAQ